jgi:hypothetical protein
LPICTERSFNDYWAAYFIGNSESGKMIFVFSRKDAQMSDYMALIFPTQKSANDDYATGVICAELLMLFRIAEAATAWRFQYKHIIRLHFSLI